MSTHHEIGGKGEALARDFLINNGYLIAEMNWRYGRAEIDIIAKHQDILVFVEVKTRSYKFFGPPEDFVSKKKINFISQAASAYMEKVKYSWVIRFDIIAIVLNDNCLPIITHYKDAFFKGLV